jgi:hypothetical protein
MSLNIDFETATMDQLDMLSIDQLLGVNIADVDLSSSLPDGVYVGMLTKKELKKREAKPEENKKAGLNVQLQVKVVKCLQTTESDVDKEGLAGRNHFQNFPWHIAMGKENMAKLVLGILGISYKDKAAIAEVGSDLNGLLDQLIEQKVAFGFTIKNRESGGFENCDIVFKEKSFVPADKVGEFLD